jgi:hypothetical protein
MTYSQNYTTLEQEYNDLVEGRSWIENPEQRLIWAIIERAVRDALGNQSADVLNATEWIWELSGEALSPFSFSWCCETLGLDTEKMRQKIMNMRTTLQKSPLPLAA